MENVLSVSVNERTVINLKVTGIVKGVIRSTPETERLRLNTIILNTGDVLNVTIIKIPDI